MFKQLWLYADRERWKVVVYLSLHTVSLLGELGQPFALSMIMSTLQSNRATVIDEVIQWVLFYVLCFSVFEMFHRGARNIERFVSFRSRRRFVLAMYDHLQSLPLRWHTDNHSGAVIDRVNKAADGLHSFCVSQYTYVAFFMKFWGPLIILWQISPAVSAITVCSGILSVMITKRLYQWSVPEYRAQNDKFHQVAAALHDYISNIRTIITLRLGPSAKKDLEARVNKAFPHIVKEHHITQIKCFIAASIFMLLEVGTIFYYIVSQKQAGQPILIGSVTAIFFYIRQCVSSFKFYTFDYEAVIHQKNDFEAVQPICSERERSHTKLEERTVLDPWNRLHVQSLYFSYGDERSRLDDISLTLTKGRKIALVGESGAGKSTMLQLLRGLLSPQEGTLISDEGKSLPLSSLGGITTLIPQEPEIFENTIRYNITMGMLATDEDLLSAIRIAGFGDVLERLPNGLESDVREKGVTLSGGEKQRLALARGIFSIQDSEIVLLDEPTSNVDPSNEWNIFEALFEHLSGRCVVSVLHRLHLVQHFNYVYVFKKGTIVEEGTFADLCGRNGEFTRLWNKYLADGDARDRNVSVT
ncbi:Putative multidrug export ATP-binding/permease protein [Paenibacillus allorhizosphaerae]|uniref:Multidrug export ATP-binding/permease protein n=1 Tax=Paenibacillus allorhizosphaerae TaxID=2849866 RepID=A0ABM8VG43_9BACL|nr:Putative multidrug export ATP-binding/permease protein [Paenibacillus allorhizosphaerae]